jgi:hypothetical protein
MSDTADIRLYVIPTKVSCQVYDCAMLSAVGLVTAEETAEKLPGGSWVEIWLRTATGKQRRLISEKCRVPDAEKGFTYDPTLQQAARLAVMVERWNGIEEAPSMSAYDHLRDPLIDAIDAQILAAMYPSAEGNPNFFAQWKSNAAALEANSPSP